MRVLANSAGYVIAISTAPALDPAMILRRGFGLSFFAGCCVLMPVSAMGAAVVDAMAGELFACAAAAASMLVSVRESSRYVCVYEEGQEEEEGK